MLRRRLRPVRRLSLAAVAALAAGTLAAPVAAAAPAARAGTPAPAVPRLAWGPCGPGLERFECTTAEVPTDYDRPRGATTAIALIRLPAGDPGRRIGSLFVNPGGPGGSGVEFVANAADVAFSAEVRARYDVVGFDPRGVAASDPATCFRTAEDEATSPLLAVGYPLTAAEERRFTRENAELAIRCQTTSPRRFATASTANVARDLDLLRAAVGDRRLGYVGYSYGTFLGATYARLFPDRVGRFVLDGTVDPVAWTGTGRGDAAASVPLGVRVRQGLGARETFAEFARLCREAGPGRCALAALGDPAEVTFDLLDRLATDPVTIELPDGTPFVVNQQILVAELFNALYAPSVWSEVAEVLALLAAPVPQPAAIGAAAARVYGPLGARARGEDYPSIGGALASICVDANHSRRPLQYPAVADRQDRISPYFGRFRAWAGQTCEFWGLRDEDAVKGPWRQTTDATVLVLGTRFDPATPYRQTRPYADLWKDARMLTVDGWGHTTLGKSTCADAAITSYLTGAGAPADGTVCAQDDEPFSAPPPAARRSGAWTPPTDVPPGLPFW